MVINPIQINFLSGKFFGIQPFDHIFQSIGKLQDICIRFRFDTDGNAFFSAVQHGGIAFFIAEIDRRQIDHPYALHPRGANDDIFDIFGRFKFGNGSNAIIATPHPQRTGRNIDIFRSEGIDQIGYGQPVGGQSFRLNNNVHFAFNAAADKQVRHPLGALEILPDVVFKVGAVGIRRTRIATGGL